MAVETPPQARRRMLDRLAPDALANLLQAVAVAARATGDKHFHSAAGAS